MSDETGFLKMHSASAKNYIHILTTLVSMVTFLADTWQTADYSNFGVSAGYQQVSTKLNLKEKMLIVFF